MGPPRRDWALCPHSPASSSLCPTWPARSLQAARSRPLLEWPRDRGGDLPRPGWPTPSNPAWAFHPRPCGLSSTRTSSPGALNMEEARMTSGRLGTCHRQPGGLLCLGTHPVKFRTPGPGQHSESPWWVASLPCGCPPGIRPCTGAEALSQTKAGRWVSRNQPEEGAEPGPGPVAEVRGGTKSPLLLPRDKAPQRWAPCPPQALITAAILCPQAQPCMVTWHHSCP